MKGDEKEEYYSKRSKNIKGIKRNKQGNEETKTKEDLKGDEEENYSKRNQEEEEAKRNSEGKRN